MKLTEMKCDACEGGMPPLNKVEAEVLLKQVPEWKISEDGKELQRKFSFKDFKEALAFGNKVGELAEEEGHHPDMTISWGSVAVVLTTHAIGGLSNNDFILASKIDTL